MQALVAEAWAENQKLVLKPKYKLDWLQMHRRLAWCNSKSDMDRYSFDLVEASFRSLPIIPCGLY